MTDQTPTPDPKLTVDQRTAATVRWLAYAVNGLWSLAHDVGVDETQRPALRTAAVRTADILIGLYPDDAIADAGEMAKTWREVRGQEPTSEEIQHVYIAMVHYLVPLAEPPLPGEQDA